MENEARAQAEIYRLYSKAMYHVSLRIIGNREDAEDVLQESFIKAFRSIADFRQESSLGSWLKRIVVNRSLNHLRGRIHFTDVPDDLVLEEEPLQENEMPSYEVNDVRQAMALLPDGFRTVFSLYFFEEYGHKEIGEMLGVSEGTSKSQLSRAKQRLKEILIENERRQA